MTTTVQEFRERLFNAKESERRRSACASFFEKLAHIHPPADSPAPATLSLAVLKVIEAMAEAERSGVIGKFAITGGMGVTYHSEPVYTADPDVLAFIPCAGGLIDLGPIYESFRQRGAAAPGEYLVLDGLKFQFIPAATPLESESLSSAVQATERGVSFLVVDIEYLVALKLCAGRAKGLLHIQIVRDAPRRPIDFPRLERILRAHQFSAKWEQFRSRFSSGT